MNHLTDAWITFTEIVRGLAQFHWAPCHFTLLPDVAGTSEFGALGAMFAFVFGAIAALVVGDGDTRLSFRAKTLFYTIILPAYTIVSIYTSHLIGLLVVVALFLFAVSLSIWTVASFLRSLKYNAWAPIGSPAPTPVEPEPEAPAELIASSRPANELIADVQGRKQ